MSTTTDAGSLSRLHDIVVPDPVSWWPLAPFWHLLAVVLCGAALWGCWRAVRRHRRDAYRRAALQALEALGERRDLTTTGHIAELALLLRRTALSAWPRQRIAPLTGDAWLAFLDASGHTSSFSMGAGRWLLRATYAPSTPVPDAEARALQEAVEHWIRRHDAGAANDGALRVGSG